MSEDQPILPPCRHERLAFCPQPTRTFAPDERPHEYREAPGGGFQVVPINSPPFTTEQEKRLREIAWRAAVAFSVYWSYQSAGRSMDAATFRDDFISGGK
jgi:hypothetical protein